MVMNQTRLWSFQLADTTVGALLRIGSDRIEVGGVKWDCLLRRTAAIQRSHGSEPSRYP